jgi:hypothetical protein
VVASSSGWPGAPGTHAVVAWRAGAAEGVAVAVEHDDAGRVVHGLGWRRGPRRGAGPAGGSARGLLARRAAAVRAVGAGMFLAQALEVPVCAPAPAFAAAAGLSRLV